MSMRSLKEVVSAFASCTADRSDVRKSFHSRATPTFYKDVVNIVSDNADYELRKTAFTVVAMMTEGGDTDACNAFLSQGIIPVILTVLHSGQSTSTMMKLVFVIIGNFTVKNNVVKEAIAEAGGFSHILRLVDEATDNDVIYRGINCIGCIMNKSESICSKYGEMVSGTLTNILRRCTRTPMDNRPTYECAKIVSNTLIIVELIVSVQKSLAIAYIPTLVKMASDHNVLAAKTLASLCKDNSQVQHMALHNGGITSIAEMHKKGSEWLGPADNAIDNLMHMLTFYMTSNVENEFERIHVDRALAKVNECAVKMRMAMFDMFLNNMV
jgi:hypothetical protein